MSENVKLLDKVLRRALNEFFGPESATVKRILLYPAYVSGFVWHEGDSSITLNFASMKEAKNCITEWAQAELVYTNAEWLIYQVKVSW